MKKIIFYLLLFLIVTNLQVLSQDTLRVVQYNLLYYGLDDEGCNSQNNNIQDKTEYLKTIVNYLKPDIFAVNEIFANENVQDYLLANVFILNGYNFARGTTKGEYLTNQIFYNKNKLGLLSEDEIYSYPRNEYVYKFYYKSPDLASGADTIFIYYIVCHLKAGSDESNVNTRTSASIYIENYLEDNLAGENIILSGDLNLYTSDEPAYQNLVNNENETIRLFDPGPEGDYHDNENFALYHTQSTNYYSDGCKASGGLNDRFDYILFSYPLLNASNKIRYIDNSFKVIGQDGQHFNMSVYYNGNNSVPSLVLDALANNSDHLPVYAEFFINQTPAKINGEFPTQKRITITNPAEDFVKLIIWDNEILKNESIEISFYDILGRKQQTENLKLSPRRIEYEVNTAKLSNGIYLMKISAKNETIGSFTIIKR